MNLPIDIGPVGNDALNLGPVNLDLDVLADLGQFQDVESGFAAVNALDANLSGQLSGLHLDGFGANGYLVDDFRVSAGANYDQFASGFHGSAGPLTYLLDNLRLSSQVRLDKLAGVEAFGNRTYLVDALRLSAGARNTSALDLFGTSPTSASLADLFRVSAQTRLDRLAGTDLLGGTHLVDSLRLSATAGNDLFGKLGGRNWLTLRNLTRLSEQVTGEKVARADVLGLKAYLLDNVRLSSQLSNGVLGAIQERPGVWTQITTRLSGQVLADQVAGVGNGGQVVQLLDDLGLDAVARNQLLADLLAEPERSSQIVDHLQALLSVRR